MSKVKWLILGLALMLTGCLKPAPAPNIVHYRLDAISHFTTAQHTHKTLLVTAPTAAPGYQTNKIIYSVQPLELSAYAKHQWIAPPAQMLQPLITQSLKNTNYFSAVIASPMVANVDYFLNTQLVKLQQNFHDKSSEVVLMLRASLINRENKVVMDKTYSTVQQVADQTPYSNAYATNLAVETILTRLSKDIVNAAR